MHPMNLCLLFSIDGRLLISEHIDNYGHFLVFYLLNAEFWDGCGQVNFIVAACENMISGGGMRPGDILTASNGKTIEVCITY